MRILLVALCILSGAAALAACGAPNAAPPLSSASAPRPPQPPRGQGAMHEVRATEMSQALAAIGLDPKNLPPIESLDRVRKLRLMKTFTESLGIACVDCHAGLDFAADTRRKRVAKRMYNEITRVLALENGDPVYCDSCHQGSLFILDRRDRTKVAAFMSDVLVDKMKRVDDKDHACETCHGNPPEFTFLTAWRDKPAPDIDTAGGAASAAATAAAGATASGPTEKPQPVGSKPGAASPPPAAKGGAKRPAGPRTCGDKSNLCPLQEMDARARGLRGRREGHRGAREGARSCRDVRARQVVDVVGPDEQNGRRSGATRRYGRSAQILSGLSQRIQSTLARELSDEGDPMTKIAHRMGALLVFCVTACANPAGHQPSGFAGTERADADPETEPLPPAPKSKIPDPRSPTPVASAAPSESAAPAAAAEADCGSKESPCPMQKLMKGSMATATTPEALAAAFTRVAALSPNPSWQWAAISQKGAELAKSGDSAGAKAQCKVCHDQYREPYKKQYRARKI